MAKTAKAILENKFLYKTFLMDSVKQTASELVEVTAIKGKSIIFKSLLDGTSYKVKATFAAKWTKISDTKANAMMNKFVVNSNGENRWLFNFVGGGFNDIWCKGGKRKAIKLAQAKYTYPINVESFNKATEKSSQTWNMNAHMMCV